MPPSPAPPLRLYAPAEIVPDSILDGFRHRSGMSVVRQDFDAPADAARAIREQDPLDLALLPAEFLPELIAQGRLSRLDVAGIPAFTHLPPAFRDLVHDPANRYSIPLAYGTVGLIVRPDRLPSLPLRWSDLSAPAYAGRIAARQRPRDLLGAALLALGRQADSEDPRELGQARAYLTRLGPPALRLESLERSAEAIFADPATAILIGRAADYQAARRVGQDVVFILPAEGGLIWSEHWVVPASGAGRAAALALIDFCLQPDIAAQITRETGVATANESLNAQLSPTELADSVIFPAPEVLARSRFQLPQSPSGPAAYEAEWAALRDALAGGTP